MLAVVGIAVSATAPRHGLHAIRKAGLLAAPESIAFVTPAFTVTVVSAQVTAGGQISADFKIADSNGLPLDRTGASTPGPLTLTFICSYIPQGQSQYVSYTTRVRTDAATGLSATQATGDTGGTFQNVAPGEYIYTFAAAAPASLDRSATHTVGVWATRNLSAFSLSNTFSDAAYTFVPNGSPVQTVRDIVKTASCNQCHDPISAHGGARRSVEVCILCHTPQTSDPVTGTVDFPVLVHKIHRGSSLPSVVAGGSFKVGTTDFSSIVFPTDVRNCTMCHQQTTGAKQAQNYATNPTRAACGSCHDNVNFVTGANHVNNPQSTDNQCSTCHIPQGDLDFDASVLGAHVVANESTTLTGTVFGLLKVDNATAGQKPTVTFTLKDKGGNPILPSAMTRLTLVLAGPTTDYSAFVSESALAATGNSSTGTYSYTFTNAIPAGATGSYTIGIEGYRNVILAPNTDKQVTARDIGKNQEITFPADATPVANRRVVVSVDKCTACHFSLTPHGGTRNQTTECVLCHNPNQTDSASPAQGINFATLVHKIHRGACLLYTSDAADE